MQFPDPLTLDWPTLYSVTLRSIEGTEARYVAMTRFGQAKAVALATEMHVKRRLFRVFSVGVRDDGPAPRTKEGLVGDGPPGYLSDPNEY